MQESKMTECTARWGRTPLWKVASAPC